MAAITQIVGFQREGTDFGTESNRQVQTEILLVEAETPLTLVQDIITALPSFFSGPGTVAFNPLQLTLTLNQSRHPSNPAFILENVTNAKRTTVNDRFWEFTCVYSSGGVGGQAGVGPTGVTLPKDKRKDQKVLKPDSTVEADNTPIVDPSTRPPVWSGNSKIVMRKSFYSLANQLIRHTNGLPLTKPVAIPVVVKAWTWEWNIDVSNFDIGDTDDIENKCNDAGFTIHQNIAGGAGDYFVEKEKMKCTGMTQQEVWETPSGTGDTPPPQFHFVRIRASFEITVDKWTDPPLSMHTRAYRTAVNQVLIPIQINDRGDEAKDTWPLRPNGTAIDYIELPDAIITDYGVLQAINPIGGLEEDLVVCETADFDAFFLLNNLQLPHVMTI